MYLPYINACTLVIYQRTFCILTLQLCLQRDTRFNRSWNKKYENSNIFFLLIVRGLRGAGQAYAQPPLSLPSLPPVDAQELPTERSLKVLRLKGTSHETASSQAMTERL